MLSHSNHIKQRGSMKSSFTKREQSERGKILHHYNMIVISPLPSHLRTIGNIELKRSRKQVCKNQEKKESMIPSIDDSHAVCKRRGRGNDEGNLDRVLDMVWGDDMHSSPLGMSLIMTRM